MGCTSSKDTVVAIRSTKETLAYKISNIDPPSPNMKKLLLSKYAVESHTMSPLLKSLYETIFANEELEIEEISFEYERFSVETLYNLKTILPFFKNTIKLKLFKLDLDSRFLKNLSLEIENLVNLQYLNLSFNRLNYLSGDLVGDLAWKLKLLKTLDLQENEMGDEGVKKISRHFFGMSALEILRLDCNEITNLGAVEVIRNLNVCNHIKVLGISKNRIDDGLYEDLRIFYRGVPSLEEILYEGNFFSDHVIELLKIQLPNRYK